MGRYKTKIQSIREANQRILNEQGGLGGKTIFQIKLSEEWGKGVDNKGELFFEDYDKAIDYLTSNGYEYKDYILLI